MATGSGPLVSLSLTHVYYTAHDPVSFVCAWLALVPQALCVVYVTLIWSTREAEVALAFAGQLACEAVNFVLKRLIKEERPRHRLAAAAATMAAKAAEAAAAADAGLPHRGKPAPGYGMPSSHAQFAGFWAVTVTLFLLVRYRPSGGSSGHTASLQLSFSERVVVSALACLLAVLIAWSRIYLQYHTVRQVLAGGVAGCAVGVAWFIATAWVRQWGLLGWALDLPPARWLRLRDLAADEDVLQAGWERWEARRAVQRSEKDK